MQMVATRQAYRAIPHQVRGIPDGKNPLLEKREKWATRPSQLRLRMQMVATRLFPDSAALDEQSRLVVANWVAKFNTHRITFTFPVLNRAAEVMFMASGADKAEMLHQVLEGKNTPQLPSQRVQPSDGKLLWLLDEAAAAKLTK
jgi:hypothetical protein